ncbi:MAG: hypothetical protein FWH38_05225 [Treponema sp.]|nr:hypothetical protein [Treponema sp.]
MKILFNDLLQNEPGLPEELKSPSLAEKIFYSGAGPVQFDLHNPVTINAIGIGGHGGISGVTVFDSGGSSAEAAICGEAGLYLLDREITAVKIVFSVNGERPRIGRLAAGISVNIPTAVAKEPGYASTSRPRRSLSGQVLPGLTGYSYRTLSLDSRYKIGGEALREIEAGYCYIAAGYPFFIDLSDESYKLPFSRLYASDTGQLAMGFEGGITRFLYSRRFNFEERF